MTHPVLVSIAIPAFNATFLRRALQSALGQDYPYLEVVIGDDSSDDQIKTICEELAALSVIPVRYERNSTPLGFARNLLACLERCEGELVKFLCDDDLLMASCISAQAQVFAHCPQVSIVSGQHFLCDAEDTLLPSRLLNCRISPVSAVLKGGDLLELIASAAPNLVGGISHALMRTEQVREFLPALVQDGQGFVARLDMALYTCLLRRGDLAYLQDVLSLERLHHGRLSHRAAMTLASERETEWLLQMLESRLVDPAPATGWVRYRPLGDDRVQSSEPWQELDLQRLYFGQVANFQQQIGSDSLSFDELYDEWLECRRLSVGQLQLLPKRIEQWSTRPRIVPVIIAPQAEEGVLASTLESLACQSYPAHEVWVLTDDDVQLPTSVGTHVRRFELQGAVATQLNQRLNEEPQADWIILMQPGDRLHPHALVIMAERMVLRPDCACVYADEGAHDGLRASSPVFKPDFNLDLMRSMPYVGRVLAFDSAMVRDIGGFDAAFQDLAPHDVIWRMVESRGLHVVEHIAELLVQSRTTYEGWLVNVASQGVADKVVHAHLRRLNVQGRVETLGGGLFTRVFYAHDATAPVSILVRAGRDVQALVRCVESIFEHTAYANHEVLIVTDGHEPQPLVDWLQAMRGLGSEQLRVVSGNGLTPAAALNQASSLARGDYLLLLDAQCMVFERGWLDELMSHARRPEVGVVGPKLCDADGKVAGAGLVLGLHGPAGTPFLGYSASSASYMSRADLVQNWSAVSQDCLLVRREIFVALGGLDCERLQQGLLDADLCLRVRELGYLVVWTPHALVAKLGTAAVNTLECDKEAFYERWLPQVANDPAYNRNLSLTRASFNLEPGHRSGWDPFIGRVLPSVLALPINTTAVGHYRVAQPFSELERAGWIQGRLNYSTPGMLELEREKPDVVILQCRYTSAAINEIERIKRYSNARRIYEIDDYILDVPKKNAHGRNMPSNMREMVTRGIGLCDRLVVSTEPLADALRGMIDDIRVVPNMLAAPLWGDLASQRQTSARPRVGWAGGTSHGGDLELLIDVVKTLADEVDWVFFGMCPEILRPYIKEFHKGVPMGLYPRKLASLNLDLALAPLEQNLFNDCKSNLRLLEYGACGFPVVCTDTKAYQGYLPCTRVLTNRSEEWLAAIRMHLNDPAASYREGDALREAVLRDYVLTQRNLQHWANGWLAD
ncbi:glycosyltransferase [Pseudomonas sp. UFMG81]|uniref:glycosyltransferase n=1 Tax=Pseudomonas sp. UFMG81 TaxID=2745936 RepID=UPI00189047DC|nr:glycosyltransferase [Pseudomonas sp. UFMG81]